MSYYPSHINKHFLEPRNVGEVSAASASAEAGSFECGAILRLSLEIDEETRRIRDA